MNYIKISEIRVLNLNQLYDFEFELRDSLKGGIVMDCVFTGIVSKKGQVVIPIQIRKALGLKKGSKVSFELKNGEITIKKLPTALD